MILKVRSVEYIGEENKMLRVVNLGVLLSFMLKLIKDNRNGKFLTTKCRLDRVKVSIFKT